MNKNRLLLMLVAADVLLAFATIGAEMFFGWTFPPPLAEYAQHRFNRLPAGGDVIPLLLLVVSVCTAFVAWIGLVNYWRLARRLYLVSWGSWILLRLISGPSVMNSVAATVTELDALVGGAILGLVYFSDLAHRFERAPVEGAAPAGMNLGADRS